MKILITGICGFTGSTLARELAKEGNEVCGLDNFLREGSRGNVEPLRKLGIRVEEGDIRNEADLAKMPKEDWVLDCAAEPSVLAGVGSGMGSYELMDHNLIGTIRVLEHCKKTQAGLILLSTSRVYSVAGLSNLNVEVKDGAFRLGLGLRLSKAAGGRLQATGSAEAESGKRPSFAPNLADSGGATEGLAERGLSTKGISEEFSTEPPLSLYGASKRCAEVLAMEYGDAFGFPVWINRCGVLAGKGQFGKADQGIFSFWIRSWKENRALKYIGFDGKGSQVRDCLHPKDLLPVLKKQMGGSVNVKVNVKEDGKAKKSERVDPRICNFGGGVGNSCSLAQLSEWCEKKFGARKVESDPKPRPYDLPWVVLDSSRAKRLWGFEVRTSLETILSEIADS